MTKDLPIREPDPIRQVGDGQVAEIICEEAMYDLIGDIHGHADELVQLLETLGYQKPRAFTSIPNARWYFSATFIDRGPQIRQVLEIVRTIVEGGKALAVLSRVVKFFEDGHAEVFDLDAPKPAKSDLLYQFKVTLPPEDCGGVWGDCDFLETIRNKKHEQHEEMLEWIGGRFDFQAFDRKQVTKEMKKGLPDWRKMS